MTSGSGARTARYLELELRVDDVDVASGILWGLGVDAIEELAVVDPSDQHSPATALLRTAAGEGTPPEDLLAGVLGSVSVIAHRLVTVPDSEWLDAWRDHARAEPVGEQIWLRPAWLDSPAPPDERVDVAIDPGRAFGSGSHESTRLALLLLERLLTAGSPTRVLDVGCGSGVLGIAAVLLDAGHTRAVDVDPEAVAATAANAAGNGVADRVEVDTTPIAELTGDYDVVVANILAPVLVELAGDLVARTADGGHLILAGYLEDQAEQVLTALEDAAAVRGARLEVIDSAAEAGWSACALAKLQR